MNISYQIAYVPMPHACNDIKIVVDKHTDPRNLRMFAEVEAVKLDVFDHKGRNCKKTY